MRIRTEKSIIRKESSVFSPQLTEELHVVTKIDRSKLPYVFTLDSKDSMRYYAWSLVKVDRTVHSLLQEKSKYSPVIANKVENNSMIRVLNIIPQKTIALRSGRSLISPTNVMYHINRNGSEEYVDKPTMLLYKKLFSSNIKFLYDDHLLRDPLYRSHII